MQVSYKRLWKLLIDKEMKRSSLQQLAHISSRSVAKLGKNESVSTDILIKICEALSCNLSDIMELVSETEESKNSISETENSQEIPPMSTEVRFIDLFAGIGGFRTAFERCGFKCVFSSEYDEACQDVYEMNYGERPAGDITKIEASSIPDFDILCAGFPCQPFSICGKKRGFEDTRGTLFFDVCRIITEKKPKVVVLENVKHLINHDKKRTFNVIISTLEEIGYHVTYRVLDSSNYGVPQCRERIIIVGCKTGFFNFDDMRKSPPKTINDILDIEGDFTYLRPEEYTLLDKSLVRKQPSGLIFCGYRNKGTWKTGVRPHTEHLSRVHRQPNRIYSTDGVHPTLPSQESSGRFWIYIPNEKKVRKLTISECYKLMGFPASFKIAENRSSAYKQCGNSVVVPMIQKLAEAIKRQGFCDGNMGQFDSLCDGRLFE